MLLLIDNYDSFTYNLYQYFSHYTQVEVIKNDDERLLSEDLTRYQALILSPGPSVPKKAGYMPKVISKYYDKLPIFGICLGHQALVEHFGGNTVLAPTVKHGKVSTISHDSEALFKHLPKSLEVMRYHSLVAEEASFPECLWVTARSLDDKTIQAFRHKSLPIYGVQFHPESIGTPEGKTIIENFLKLCNPKEADTKRTKP